MEYILIIVLLKLIPKKLKIKTKNNLIELEWSKEKK
jgi:hypothetical protein